jgi:periplasmic divalent cation tolerance protein
MIIWRESKVFNDEGGLMSSFVVVFVTTPSPAESRKISDSLLKGRLAACVNILPGIASRYWWKGKIGTGREELLIVKTARRKLPALIRRVKALHSYKVPEIVSLPISAGNPDYLQWINDSLKGGPPGRARAR